MTIDIYIVPGSPPCRAAILTAAVLDIPVVVKRVNIFAKEQLKPEFVQMNPQHTVPTIDDNGFILWESRAIMIYLVDKYGKSDDLYPKDPQIRGVINQRLFFDMGTLIDSFNQYYHVIIFARKNPQPGAFEKVKFAMDLLDGFLKNETFVAGKKLTLADLAIVATISTFEIAGFEFADYPNISRWYDTMKKETPRYEDTNGKMCADLKRVFEKLKSRPMNE